MQRRGHAGSPQPGRAPTGREDWEIEVRLEPYPIADPETLDERAVVGTTPKKDVLPVVEPQAFVTERPGGAAEPPPTLDEGDTGASVGAGQRRGHARQASAHDDDA
jgi:hypothetical protein